MLIFLKNIMELLFKVLLFYSNKLQSLGGSQKQQRLKLKVRITEKFEQINQTNPEDQVCTEQAYPENVPFVLLTRMLPGI